MRELAVFQIDSAGRATMGMGTTPKYVEGINRLLQIVMLKILENPGRDVMNPSSGSGLRALIGKTNIDDPQELRADIMLAVGKIQSDILREQALTADPATERLKTIQVISVTPGTDSVDLVIKVINQVGDTKQLVL